MFWNFVREYIAALTVVCFPWILLFEQKSRTDETWLLNEEDNSYEREL
jgi:hypothetical protein